jgi:WD40 repeat protein/serine/threonine protein kinase/tetratricopeptide (TPR) repeat protein
MNEQSIFAEALERADPHDRAAYLDQACGGDSAVRQRIERLLTQHQHAGAFLESPPFPSPTIDDPIAEHAGTVIGPYKLLEQIGEGGFGVVFMAEQTHPVRRKVALKVLKPGMDTQQVVARFEAERQALAIMDHPNIARVFDGGATLSGRPYFVMELVKGVPITDYCDQNHLRPRERLELFVSVCYAVQHAHQKGIIHRDLKPSNVLVMMHDTMPVVKVIDFGVAKALGQELTDKTLFTGFAQMIGTPLYMSPEQAGQSGLDIDTRSDIYSLGVLLYELLTGTTPFDKDRFKQAACDEIRRIIREEEPPKPSTRLSSTEALPSIAANRGLEPAKLSSVVRGELDWVVMKCLEKDRNRRYETANSLVMDIQRHLHDEPVLACPPSVRYRFRKFARRNKAAVAMASVLSVAFFAGLAGLVVSNFLVARERDAKDHALRQETRALARAMEQEQLAAQNAEEANKQATVAAQQASRARVQEITARRRFYAAQLNLAQQALESGNMARALDLIETQRPRFGQEDLRTFEWYYLWRLCHCGHRFTLSAWKGQTRFISSGGPTRRLAISPDGRTLATGGWDERVRLWDISTGRLQAILEGPASTGMVTCVAFSHDGQTVASGHFGGGIGLWDVVTYRSKKQLTAPATIWCVAFSPDGKMLVTAGYDTTVRLWDLPSGHNVHTFQPGMGDTMSVAFAPDGQTVASGGWGGKVTVWDVAKRKERFTVPGGDPIIFLPDGTLAYGFGGRGGHIGFLNIETGSEQSSLPVGSQSWAFSPDGKVIALEDWARNVKIYDLATQQTRAHHGRLTTVTCLVFSPDGRTLVSGAEDDGVEVWDAFPDEDAAVIKQPGVRSIIFSQDGKTVAAVSSASAEVVEVATDRHVASISIDLTRPGVESGVTPCALSVDGKVLAVAGGERIVRLVDVSTSEELRSLQGHAATVLTVAFSPDGKTLASGGLDGTCILWDIHAGKPRTTLGHGLPVATVAFSPNSQVLATAGHQGFTKLWNASTGKELAVLHGEYLGHHHRIWSAAFSADGKTLATSGNFGAVKLWDVERGILRASLKGHTGGVTSVAIFGDGKTLVTADGSAKFWCPDTGQERITLKNVRAVAIAPDGKTLAIGKSDGTVRFLSQLGRSPTDAEAQAYRTELDADDAHDPSGHIHGADHLYAGRRHEEAAAAYQQALSRLQELAAHDAKTPEYRAELAYCHFALSLVLQAHGRSEEAAQTRQAGLAIYRKLIADFPNSPELQSAPIDRLLDLTQLVARAGPFLEISYFLSLVANMDGSGPIASVNASRSAWITAPRLQRIGLLCLQQGFEAQKEGRPQAASELCDKATDHLQKAVELGASPVVWYQLALARLGADDWVGYRAVCAKTAKRLDSADDVTGNELALWGCALAADAVSDYSPLLQAAEKLVASDPKNFGCLKTLGALLCRAGRFEDALQCFNDAQAVYSPAEERSTTIIYNWFFLAMVHHRLGHTDEAVQWLNRAVKKIEQDEQEKQADSGGTISWNRALTLKCLRRETEEALQQ